MQNYYPVAARDAQSWWSATIVIDYLKQNQSVLNINLIRKILISIFNFDVRFQKIYNIINNNTYQVDIVYFILLKPIRHGMMR